MNTKLKTLLTAIAFVAFIIIAFFAYHQLAGRYGAGNPLTGPGVTQLSGDRGKADAQSVERTDSTANTDANAGKDQQSNATDGDKVDAGPENEDKIKAPDFTVQDMNGTSVKLSDFEGKPVVLNFWASWCPPCKAEMPYFDNVYKELGEEIHFVMVDLVDGQRETLDKGKKYIEDSGFSFPVYFDIEQEAAYTYNVTSIPTTLFIDKDGYIVAGLQGQMEEDTLRKGIELSQ